jgi:hypothetical protein
MLEYDGVIDSVVVYDKVARVLSEADTDTEAEDEVLLDGDEEILMDGEMEELKLLTVVALILTEGEKEDDTVSEGVTLLAEPDTLREGVTEFDAELLTEHDAVVDGEDEPGNDAE